MRLGFIADVHIKLGQKNVPVEWAKNRYKILFEQIEKHNNSVDKWVIGGDIFDRVPTVEEMAIFFDMLLVFKKPTIMYPGNHESVKKDTTFLTALKKPTSIINPKVEIIDEFYTDELGIDYIPYNRLKQYHPSDIDFHGDILCTHVRGEIPPHVKPEVPLELFDRWKVVLAGDLHSYDNCQRNILYPGSPVTTSFHRNLVDTGFIILDTDTLEHEWIKFEVPQLIRKTINVGDPMPATSYHHTIYEIEGDLAELGSLQDSELIDKKVVKRESDTALILDPSYTMIQEVEEYLRYILQLNDTTVKDVLKEYAEYDPKINSI